jgi:ribonuclease HII
MGVKDSKKLSTRRREEIYQGVLSHGITHAVELISPSILERTDLSPYEEDHVMVRARYG